MKKLLKYFSAAVFCAVIMCCAVFSSNAANEGKWIAAWGTAPTQISIQGYENIAPIAGEVTARTVITPTASGSKLRIRISNLYGKDSLKINSITVAKSTSKSIDSDKVTSEIDVSTSKSVLFNGSTRVEVPKGKEICSDPVSFDVVAMENIAVSIYVESITEIRTMGLSGGTTFLSIGEDATYEKSFGVDAGDKYVMDLINSVLPFNLDLKLTYSIVRVIPCLSGIDVYSDKDAYSVAVIGDSTVANDFPMYLAEQINNHGTSDVGVMGKGILGNRLLGDGLGYIGFIFGDSMIDRLQRDVLSQTGIKYVVVKIGANDIMHPVCSDIQKAYPGIKQPTAKQLEAGFSKVFQAVHKAGKKVIVIGITQWKGNTRNYFNSGDKYVRTPAEFNKDWKIAKDVNDWLASTKEHDGYINFNKISASDNDPDAFRPEYTIDGAHPTVLLQQIWAKNFPLGLIGVTTRVGSVRLNTTSVQLNKGNTKKLTATILPANAKNKKVTWSSSNEKVASVSSNGTVKAVSAGKAKITCKTVDGGYKATCTVTVIVPVTGIKLSQTTAKIYNTKTIKLKATVSPSNATDTSVKWTTSNAKIAKVDSKGKVTAVGSGTATITCTTVSGKKKATCKITVLKKTEVTLITLNTSSKSVYKNKTYQLKATVSPAKATFKDVKWKSSNNSIATVDSNGLVKAIKVGTAYITCTSVDNKLISARCKIEVKSKVTGVSLKNVSVYKDATKTLTPTFTPSDATNKKVTWKSSNKSIVTVNSKGVITGVKVGTAYVTCKTADGGFTAKCKVTVNRVIKSTKVTLNKTKCTIDDGKSITLTFTISPSNASYKKVKWSSSDSSIAKVSSNGVVKGIKPGKATITCKTTDTGKTAKCVVTVKAVAVKSVKLNKSSVTLDDGKTYTLKATIDPTNATTKTVTWKSGNTKIATVSSNGKVKAIAPGKVTITCTTKNGKKTAKCIVTVKKVKVSKIKLNKTYVALEYSNTTKLNALISPTNATNKKVKWSSSNPKIAKVDSTGKVTATGKGTATITCKSADGAAKAKCTVKVNKKDVIGLKLNSTRIRINKGGTYQLKVEVLPSNASDKTVKWSSSNTSIATVNSKGVVTGKAKGKTTIKVKSADGRVTQSCTVRVR